MLKKSYSSTGKVCRVTFKFSPETEAKSVYVLGDFNNWSRGKSMKTLKDGSFSQTISLQTGQPYRFRYLTDANQWDNDNEADKYCINPFGGEDGIVEV